MSPGGALALLAIPHAFTQDGLLTTDEFIRHTKERGHSLSLALLQTLHNERLLLPLYRVSDYAVDGRRVDVRSRMRVARPRLSRQATA